MEVAIQDLCLDIGGAVTVGVTVGVPYGVEVTVGDKVQVKNSTVACVQVLNSEGLPFHVSQLRLVGGVEGVVWIMNLAVLTSETCGSLVGGVH